MVKYCYEFLGSLVLVAHTFSIPSNFETINTTILNEPPPQARPLSPPHCSETAPTDQDDDQDSKESCTSSSVECTDLTSLNWLHNITNIMSVPSIPTPAPLSPKKEKPRKKINQTIITCKEDLLLMDIKKYKSNGDKKPPFSYATLICMAMSKNRNKMTLSAIYAWIKDNFLYYRKADPSWQVSLIQLPDVWQQFDWLPDVLWQNI